MTPPPAPGPARDGGSASTELAVVTPLLVLLLLTAVSLGRLATARLDVNDAAHQAARAASLARTSEEARNDAASAARSALSGGGPSCRHLTVNTSTDGQRAGSVVRVRVTCTTALLGPAFPGHATVARTAASVIDTYRESRP
jgi:Flp pilus assembly protein TadG